MFNFLVLENVLFCIPLRIGNICMGSMGAISYMLTVIRLIIKSTAGARHFSEKFYFIYMIFLTLVQSIVCVVFVVGILKKNKDMLLPWLFSQILMTVIVTLQLIQYRSSEVVLFAIYWVLFQSYLWLCGFSIYQRTPIREAKCNDLPSTAYNILSGSLTSNKYQDQDLLPEVPVLENVLFFIPLRIGNYLMGLMGAFVYLAICIGLIMKSKTNARHISDKLYYITLISGSLVHSIVCVFFVIGIFKKKQHMLMPWLFSQVIITILIVASHLLIYRSSEAISISINWILFQGYIWYCAYSMYQRIPIRGAEYNSIPSTENDKFNKMNSSGFKYQDLNIHLKLKSVLFCIPLRTGNILLGLMGAHIYLVACICLIIKCKMDARYFSDKFYFIFMIIMSLIHSIVCVIFVVGIITKKRHMVMSWLFSQTFVTVIFIVAGTIHFKIHRSSDFISLAINWIAFQAYIWLCGYSIYQRTPTRGTEYITIPSSESDPPCKMPMSSKNQDLDLLPELPVLANVLFCIPLRIGNILMGLMGAIVYLVICICLFIKSTTDAPRISEKFYYISITGVLLIHSIACVFFVLGILKEKPRMLLTWLFSQIILTIEVVAVHLIMDRSYWVISLCINWILFQAYIWLCGYSIYQRATTRWAKYNMLLSTENNTFSGMLTSSKYQGVDDLESHTKTKYT